ncbi:hypothetical protein [Actinocorallia lasiicapitis]
MRKAVFVVVVAVVFGGGLSGSAVADEQGAGPAGVREVIDFY